MEINTPKQVKLVQTNTSLSKAVKQSAIQNNKFTSKLLYLIYWTFIHTLSLIVVLNITMENNTSTINKSLFQNPAYLSATYKNVLFSYTRLVNKFSLSSCALMIPRHLKNLGNCFTGNAFLVIKIYNGKSCINVLPKVSNKESIRKYSFLQFSRVLGKYMLI